MYHHIYFNRKTGDKVQTIVHATAMPSMQDVICYQELSGEFEFFVVSREQFMAEFTKEFKALPKKIQPRLEERGEIEEKIRRIEEKEMSEEDGTQANTYLMMFLDADTYGEKIKIFREIADKIDEVTMNSIASSLDISVEDGADGREHILSHLELQHKYERNERLR